METAFPLTPFLSLIKPHPDGLNNQTIRHFLDLKNEPKRSREPYGTILKFQGF